MACFSDLPIELIRLIASYTSYESVGSLSCVNNYFRIACQDWTVLKDLLRHTHHEAYRHVLRKESTHKLTWKQFAYAESRAEVANVNSPDFLLWAPQLVALHHPFGDTADVAHLLAGIGQESTLNARVYAFCFCVRALSFDLPPSGAVESFYSSFDRKYPVVACITDWSCRALDSSVCRLATMGPLWNEDRLMSADEWPVERDQMHAIALKALGFLSVELKSAVARGALVLPTERTSGQNHLKHSSQFAIPRSSQDIPFGSFMDLPVPFSPGSADDFTTCHLTKMVTKSLFEDGGWSGVEFGSRTSPSQTTTRIACIAQFEFVVTSEDPDSDIMEIQSRPLFGPESHAQFQIKLRKSSGVALITVQPDLLSPLVHWQGILTPFGFVGTTTLSSGDWFWLWKTDWSGTYQAKYDWTKLWGRGSMDKVQRAVATLGIRR